MYNKKIKYEGERIWKKKNGLTLISTIILLIIIIALVFTTIVIVKKVSNKEKGESIKTEFLVLQSKINNISGNYILDKNEANLKGTKLAEMKDEEKIKEFLQRNLINIEEQNKKYYVLKQQDLDEMELENIILEDGNYYIVEYTEAKIYCTKGVNIDSNTYYDMTEVENIVNK